MILKGYYKGSIKPDRFALKREYFPNNFQITGKLNQENHFEISSTYSWPMNILGMILAFCGVVFCSIQLLSGNWILSLTILVFLIFAILGSFLKSRKERKLFLDRYFECEKRIDKKSLEVVK